MFPTIQDRATVHSPLMETTIELERITATINSHDEKQDPIRTNHPCTTKIPKTLHIQTQHTQDMNLSQATTTTIENLYDEATQNDTKPFQRGGHLIQTSLTPPKLNYPFGDLLTTTKNKDHIRIYFHNVNGIFKFRNWDSLHAAAKDMIEYSIDMFGFAETNMKWNVRTNNTVRTILKKHFKTFSVSTSSSNEVIRTAYQPGRTLTCITGKYTGKIMRPIIDETGMGRWSGFSMLTNFNNEIHILTVYQSVKSDGIHSTYRQQYNTLKQLGCSNPDPRKRLMDDLATMMKQWNAKGDRTIVMIDANDSFSTRASLLHKFISQTNIVSLLHNPREHPATHSRGSQCQQIFFLMSTSQELTLSTKRLINTLIIVVSSLRLMN
jgi:hypothetical protein